MQDSGTSQLRRRNDPAIPTPHNEKDEETPKRYPGYGEKGEDKPLTRPESFFEREENPEEGIYEVDRILGKKIENNQVMYLVKWKGYEEQDANWEPQSHLKHGAQQAIKDFELIEQRIQRRTGEYEVEAILGERREPEEL